MFHRTSVDVNVGEEGNQANGECNLNRAEFSTFTQMSFNIYVTSKLIVTLQAAYNTQTAVKFEMGLRELFGNVSLEYHATDKRQKSNAVVLSLQKPIGKKGFNNTVG